MGLFDRIFQSPLQKKFDELNNKMMSINRYELPKEAVEMYKQAKAELQVLQEAIKKKEEEDVKMLIRQIEEQISALNEYQQEYHSLKLQIIEAISEMLGEKQHNTLSSLIEKSKKEEVAIFLDASGNVIYEVPTLSLISKLQDVPKGQVSMLLYNGVLTRYLVVLAKSKGITKIACKEVDANVGNVEDIEIIKFIER